MSTHDLTQGRVSGSLARLTAPMVAGVSSSILVQMLELGFIGQLSTAHVAAIVSIGTSSVIARSVGNRQISAETDVAQDCGKDQVARLGTHSLILVFTLMIVISGLCWLAIDPLFLAMGASPELLPLIHSYLDIYLPGTILFTSTMICGSIMRASGNANVPGAIMTIGALLNLILDPIFIFGWFGFPAMELAGAATAMTLTRFGTLVIFLWYIHADNLVVRKGHFSGWLRSAKRILHVGLPAMATNLIGPLTAAYITFLIADYGEAAVAGFGVANRIEAVAAMLMFALSGSIGPFVGQNWGAHMVDRVRAGVRVSYMFCLFWGLLVTLPLFFFGRELASLIDGSDSVIAVAAIYFAIVPLSYGLWGVLMMASASFNALGKPLPSTALSFGRMIIVYIPLATLLNHAFGYVGIFIATALSNVLFGIVGAKWFAQRLNAMSRQLAHQH